MTALARKLAVYVITAWVAITVNFLLPRLMPGNPIQTMIGKLQGRVTLQMQQAIQQQFGIGLHQSLWSQYVSYWSQLFHGNLGQSITLSAPVSTVLGQTLPWTVGLLGAATVISFVLGTLAGIALGWRRGSWLDGMLPVSTFFQAVPYFFLGTVLLLVLGSDPTPTTWPRSPRGSFRRASYPTRYWPERGSGRSGCRTPPRSSPGWSSSRSSRC